MFSNRLAVLAIAGASVTAAAGGGYLASRHNAASMAQARPEAAELDHALASTGEPVGSQHDDADKDQIPTAAPVLSAAARPARPPVARPARAPQPEPVVVAAAPSVPEPAPAAPELPVIEPPVPIELPRAWEPPIVEEPRFRELVVPADSVVGLEIETTISTETALVEDPVDARVVRDVHAAEDVAIPAGTRALGSVTVVEHGGRFRERARLGVRFHTLVLPDGTRLPVSTEAIYRQGDAPGRSTAAKIGGGAVAGAILGGILGGSKGAAIGASTGAGAGTAVVYAGDRSEAVFGSGLEVTARFLSPVTVTIDR